MGTSTGLVGCVRKLKIGRRVVELHAGRDPLVERSSGVRECGENPCSGLPCRNAGTCLAIDSDKFRCACAAGFTGDSCDSQVAPCASSPCAAGATCVELGSGAAFICQCPPGRKGRTCQQGTRHLHFLVKFFVFLTKIKNINFFPFCLCHKMLVFVPVFYQTCIDSIARNFLA
jgi:EGF-like domain